MDIYIDCSNGVTTNALLHAFLQLSNIQNQLSNCDSCISPSGLVLNRLIQKMNLDQDNTNIIKFKIATGGKEKKQRTFYEVKKMIEKSKYNKKTKLFAEKIFFNLAKAEASVHKETVKSVKFHEVGRRSNINKVLLLCSLITNLKIKHFYCSKINTGRGKVMTEHGLFSIPTPATKELLRGFKIFSKGKGELVTPTSAAIIKTLFKQIPNRREHG